jgi:ATP-dependent helicase/nuclease subunit B
MLVLMYPKGEGQRPSFLIKQLEAMYDISEITLAEEEYKSAAEAPYLELLLCKEQSNMQIRRENLSKQAAQSLYGKELALSATRVDRFYSCAYRHFLQSGLKLEPRTKAEFDAASAGNFVHYVLDGVFKEIKNSVGFKNTDEKLSRQLTEQYSKKFIEEVLLNFEGKSKRFEYLFRRYEAGIHYVVGDALEELKKSEFEPLDLELDISGFSNTHRGFIDRVDGFYSGDKLYLRVIDYKTRKKAYSFDLSDVMQGRDMQMLIYLFALQEHAGVLYGKEIEPAGVLYVPARDVVLNTAKNSSGDEIDKKRRKQMRRSGLIINNKAIIDAMESGEDKLYLPVKTMKDGSLTGDSLVTKRQLAMLSKHVDMKLNTAKERILNGDNECKPYYKSAVDNACTYCEYLAVCGFDEELGDKHRYSEKKPNEEIWSELGIGNENT